MKSMNANSGAYVLILELTGVITLTIGALGEYEFKSGYYAYVGSALGSNGFNRVLRHIRVSEGSNQTRKWHIDYLSSVSTIIEAHKVFTLERVECTISSAIFNSLGVSSMKGFGCSDCKCESHLYYCENLAEINEVVIKAMRQVNDIV
jgi:Uri superfamily endonuclease